MRFFEGFGRIKAGYQTWKEKGGILSIGNLLALFAVICSVNSVCIWINYQPPMPEGARRLAKGGRPQPDCDAGI
ncbi:MAG: cyclic lactone autoinducer peptide [Lachnospiraceae bacterium]|jgi:cyclic lactone autoinducer peptide|nr:cyclic lactone autoinducer peptide [Lachnospiraceae bacterium]